MTQESLQKAFANTPNGLKIAIQSVLTNEITNEFTSLLELKQYLQIQRASQKSHENATTSDAFTFSEKIKKVITFVDALARKVSLERAEMERTNDYRTVILALGKEYSVPINYRNYTQFTINLSILPTDSKLYDVDQVKSGYLYYRQEDTLDNFKIFLDIAKSPQNIFTNYVGDPKKRQVAYVYLGLILRQKKVGPASALSEAKQKEFADMVSALEKNIAQQNSNLVDFVQDTENNVKKEVDAHVADFDSRAQVVANSVAADLGDYKKQFTELEDKFEALHIAYEQKLAFEAPIKHWEKFGKNRALLAYIWAFIALVEIGTILWIANWFVAKLFTLKSVVGSNTFPQYFIPLAIISILIYMLRVFINLAVSNWHMSSEYYQKAALTTYYISMLKQDKITEDEKQFVLPFLFAKIDTGLTKGSDNTDMTALLEILMKSNKG